MTLKPKPSFCPCFYSTGTGTINRLAVRYIHHFAGKLRAEATLPSKFEKSTQSPHKHCQATAPPHTPTEGGKCTHPPTLPHLRCNDSFDNTCLTQNLKVLNSWEVLETCLAMGSTDVASHPHAANFDLTPFVLPDRRKGGNATHPHTPVRIF
jgi:hypothetical protein